MRLPPAVHEAQPWVITKIAPDFTLLDAWALPVEGDRDDRDDALDLLTSFDPAAAGSLLTRVLFAVRLRLGAWLGWDDPNKRRSIPGCRESTLSARLPDDLRATADTMRTSKALRTVAGGFTPLYKTDNEWAAEIANDTVHGVLHLAWVDQGNGRYRAQLGVYVKPRGPLGKLYLALIGPFRHLIVYPSLLRHAERAWAERRSAMSSRGTAPGSH